MPLISCLPLPTGLEPVPKAMGGSALSGGREAEVDPCQSFAVPPSEFLLENRGK